MRRHEPPLSKRPVLRLGMAAAAILVAASPAMAGGWFKKILNAQSNQPHYQNRAYQQQPDQQARLLEFNLSVRAGRAGEPAQAEANIVIQPGSNQSIQDFVNQLTVHYTLIDLHGQTRGQATESVTPTSGNALSSIMHFTPPRGVPRGHYRVQAQLLVNGSANATRTYSYDIL